MLSHSFNKDGKGQPLLMLHGFMGSGQDFVQVEELFGDPVNCLTVDLPGHGDSAAVSEDLFSMGGCSQAIIAMLDGLDLPRVDLLGYSMGGRQALYLTANYPDRFRRVVLVSASPGLREEEERLARRKHDAVLADRLRQESFDTFLDDWYNQPLFASLRADMDKLAATKEKRRSNDPEGLARSLLGMGTGSQPSLWDQLATIVQPILLITGEKDHKFCAIAREMSDLCPMACLEEVKAAGHNVPVECPREFSEVVRSFLTEPIGGS